MGIRRLAAGIFAASAMTVSALAATGSPALATPTDCSWARYTTNSIVAVCHGGTGYYAAKITCRHWYAGGTEYYYTYAYGPYKTAGSGQPSYAYCPSGDQYSTGGVALK